jgi:hypothetical protein
MALEKVASEQTKTRTARRALDVMSQLVVHFLLLIQATVMAPQAVGGGAAGHLAAGNAGAGEN